MDSYRALYAAQRKFKDLAAAHFSASISARLYRSIAVLIEVLRQTETSARAEFGSNAQEGQLNETDIHDWALLRRILMPLSPSLAFSLTLAMVELAALRTARLLRTVSAEKWQELLETTLLTIAQLRKVDASVDFPEACLQLACIVEQLLELRPQRSLTSLGLLLLSIRDDLLPVAELAFAEKLQDVTLVGRIEGRSRKI